MKNASVTVVLVTLIILAMMWSTGKLTRIFNIVFGK